MEESEQDHIRVLVLHHPAGKGSFIMTMPTSLPREKLELTDQVSCIFIFNMSPHLFHNWDNRKSQQAKILDYPTIAFLAYFAPNDFFDVSPLFCTDEEDDCLLTMRHKMHSIATTIATNDQTTPPPSPQKENRYEVAHRVQDLLRDITIEPFDNTFLPAVDSVVTFCQ
jgi:hypothetical protein